MLGSSSPPCSVATLVARRARSPRPARPRGSARVDKEVALLLSLRPRFPLSLARSLFREEHRNTETLGLARRRLAVDSGRHSRIAVTRSCASTSSSASPSPACGEAVISSPSSKYRVAVVELRRRFRRLRRASDLADRPSRTVVS